MLRCADDSLYTGITVDLAGRVAKHNAGTGAKYTRGRGPVRVVWSEEVADAREAKQREAAMKRLTKAQKEQFLCTSHSAK